GSSASSDLPLAWMLTSFWRSRGWNAFEEAAMAKRNPEPDNEVTERARSKAD
ncbi:unnamed protein product, partial [Amoebophrya sp. A25]